MDILKRMINLFEQFKNDINEGKKFWKDKVETFIKQTKELQINADVWSQLNGIQQSNIINIYNRSVNTNNELERNWEKCIPTLHSYLSGFYCLTCTPDNDLYFNYSEPLTQFYVKRKNCDFFSESCNSIWNNLFVIEFSSQCIINILRNKPLSDCAYFNNVCLLNPNLCSTYVCSFMSNLGNEIYFKSNLAFPEQQSNKLTDNSFIKNHFIKFFTSFFRRDSEFVVSPLYVNDDFGFSYPLLERGFTANYKISTLPTFPPNDTSSSSTLLFPFDYLIFFTLFLYLLNF